MRFADPKSRRFGGRREGPLWGAVLLVAATAAALAATQPWVRVRFERLFGEVFGPPAWQSSAGFTCLCTSALVAVMALAESQTRTTQRAVRPASLLLAGVMALAVVAHLARGPGMIRGVSASWTSSAYVGLAASIALLASCAARYRRSRPGGGASAPPPPAAD